MKHFFDAVKAWLCIIAVILVICALFAADLWVKIYRVGPGL